MLVLESVYRRYFQFVYRTVGAVLGVEVLEAQRIAYEILDTMAAKKREVFILAEFAQLSCDEIAEVVGAKTGRYGLGCTTHAPSSRRDSRDAASEKGTPNEAVESWAFQWVRRRKTDC